MSAPDSRDYLEQMGITDPEFVVMGEYILSQQEERREAQEARHQLRQSIFERAERSQTLGDDFESRLDPSFVRKAAILASSIMTRVGDSNQLAAEVASEATGDRLRYDEALFDGKDYTRGELLSLLKDVKKADRTRALTKDFKPMTDPDYVASKVKPLIEMEQTLKSVADNQYPDQMAGLIIACDRKLASLGRTAPTGAEIGMMLTSAYFDIYRALGRDSGMIGEVITPETRALIEATVTKDEDTIRLIEAALVAGAMFEPGLQTAGAAMISKAFLGTVVFGGKERARNIVPVSADGDIAYKDFIKSFEILSPSQELMISALYSLHKIRLATAAISTLKPYYEFAAAGPRSPGERHQGYRSYRRDTATHAPRFYAVLGEVLSERPGDKGLTLQALALEELFVNGVDENIKMGLAYGVTSPEQAASDHLNNQARLANYITALAADAEKRQSQEVIQQRIDKINARISELSEPYEYTRKRIRSFEGGMELARDIHKQLSSREFKLTEDITNALAVLVLQLEQVNGDSADYIRTLKTTRDKIAGQMGTVQYLGGRPQSTLYDALQWVEEMISQEKTIQPTRLQDFVLAYFVGQADPLELPAQQPAVQEVAEEQIADEPVEDLTLSGGETEAEDFDEAGSAEPEETQTPDEDFFMEAETARRALVESFQSTFNALLEHEDAEVVSIKVMLPGGGKKSEPEEHDVVRPDRPAGGPEVASYIDLDENRIKGMVSLKRALEKNGKTPHLYVTERTVGSPLPSLALFVPKPKDPARGVCILDNPVNGHATYVFHVDGDNIKDWTDVDGWNLDELRNLANAQPKDHPTKGIIGFGEHYTIKLYDLILTGLASIR